MKSKCSIPKGYRGEPNKRVTERLILNTQTKFEQYLMRNLNLQLVGTPLFLEKESGLNDDLNGIEKPVSFTVGDEENANLEIIHSLAKWKRNYLAEPYFHKGEGIVIRMNAIRKDEVLTNIHSYNVDQWDWETIISKEERSIEFLKATVRKIYGTLCSVQKEVHKQIKAQYEQLPEEITFIHAEDLLRIYPELTAKEREYEIVKKHDAVFIIGIGAKLSNGLPHDFRAPDYDDWSTVENGRAGLNGDILVWNPVLEEPIEISSMGIRVDKNALIDQLDITDTAERLVLPFHGKIVNEQVPFTIGGGIGRSRLTLFLLEKAHIGEVQKSYWPQEMVDTCKENKVVLL